MTEDEFDLALVGAAFSLAAERGWMQVSVAEAARRAVLALDRARERFPGRATVLRKFGTLADMMALGQPTAEAATREQLFEILMRRIDFLQSHREGVLALLRYLPADPCTAALLLRTSLRSMAWMLEGVGVSAAGPRGLLRAKGLLAVWLYTLNVWRTDAGSDLAATMAALDRALRRAEQAEGWLAGRRPAAEATTVATSAAAAAAAAAEEAAPFSPAADYPPETPGGASFDDPLPPY
jgi:hypothetical protein